MASNTGVEEEAATVVAVGGGDYASRQERQYMKLPRLERIKFDGEVKNWVHFLGQFGKINADKRMSEEIKFLYLLQATTGKARKLIENYPPASGNYTKAIDALKRRFGNP